MSHMLLLPLVTSSAVLLCAADIIWFILAIAALGKIKTMVTRSLHTD